MGEMPEPNTNIFGGQVSRPADGYGKWQYSPLSFKALWSISKETDNPIPPFKSVVSGGLKEWKDTGDYQNVFPTLDRDGDDQKLFLEDEDGWGGTSGYAHFKAGDGWQFCFYMATANDDWFDEVASGIGGAWVEDDWANQLKQALNALQSDSYPNLWYESEDVVFAQDSRAVFCMDGNKDDYVSVDIDSQSGSVGQFRIRLDGEQFTSNDEVDEEVWITMLWARRWDATYEWPTTPPPPPPPDTVCDVGYTFDLAQNKCVFTGCPEGYTEDNGTCAWDGDNPPPPPPEHECDEGYHFDAHFGICIIDEEEEEEEEEDDDDDDEEDSYSAVILVGGLVVVLYVALLLSRGAKNG